MEGHRERLSQQEMRELELQQEHAEVVLEADEAARAKLEARLAEQRAAHAQMLEEQHSRELEWQQQQELRDRQRREKEQIESAYRREQQAARARSAIDLQNKARRQRASASPGQRTQVYMSIEPHSPQRDPARSPPEHTVKSALKRVQHQWKTRIPSEPMRAPPPAP